MNFTFKNTLAVMATALLLTSCSNDDTTSNTSGNGNLEVEFDTIFGNANLILDSQPNTTSQGEILYVSDVKYIVSNIELTQEDGNVFIYPKSNGYFIVNEANLASKVLHLENIPSGNYTKIKFGIGVDEQQYNLGQTVQGDFFAIAQNEDMAWSWSAGYKHILFEGMFTSPSVTTPTPFMIHTGKSGAQYNYTNVTLNFPDKALVRTSVNPVVHIMADVSKFIDGGIKISLTENNANGMGAMIMSGDILTSITANIPAMFHVDHVHND